MFPELVVTENGLILPCMDGGRVARSARISERERRERQFEFFILDIILSNIRKVNGVY